MKKAVLLTAIILLCLQAFAQNKMFDIKYYRHVYVPSKVNGKDVKTISMDEQQTFFKNLKSVTLEIERDGAKSTVSFNFDDPKI